MSGDKKKLLTYADSGCDPISVLHSNQTEGLKVDTKSKHIITAAEGSRLNCLGSTYFKFTHPSGPTTIIFALISDAAPYPFTLGKQDQIKLGLLPKDYPHTCHFNKITGKEATDSQEMASLNNAIQKLCEKYSDVFDTSKGLKAMKGAPMKIYLKDDVKITPHRALRARPIALHQEKEANEEVQRLIQAGILRPCNKATEWLLHGFFRPKPDKTLRLVFDAKPLNRYLKSLT